MVESSRSFVRRGTLNWSTDQHRRTPGTLQFRNDGHKSPPNSHASHCSVPSAAPGNDVIAATQTQQWMPSLKAPAAGTDRRRQPLRLAVSPFRAAPARRRGITGRPRCGGHLRDDPVLVCEVRTDCANRLRRRRPRGTRRTSSGAPNYAAQAIVPEAPFTHDFSQPPSRPRHHHRETRAPEIAGTAKSARASRDSAEEMDELDRRRASAQDTVNGVSAGSHSRSPGAPTYRSGDCGAVAWSDRSRCSAWCASSIWRSAVSSGHG